MEIEFKAAVVDRDGEPLGTVDHLVRDSWTGELSKFMVRRQEPDRNLFLSVDDVEKADKDQVRLKVSLEELNQR